MSDPARDLVDALGRLVPDERTPTRLATVTDVSAAGVLVRFDGETIASPRRYYALQPAVTSNRVVMLRAGSTWVVAAPIETGQGWRTTSPPASGAGGTAITTYTSSCRWQIVSRMLTFTVRVDVQNAGAAAGAALAITMPLPCAPTPGPWVFAGRENFATGAMLQGVMEANSSTLTVMNVSNGGIIATPRAFHVSGSYEIA